MCQGCSSPAALLVLIEFLQQIRLLGKRPKAFHNCIDKKMNMINGVHSAETRFIVFLWRGDGEKMFIKIVKFLIKLY